MDDARIIDLYFARDERALSETSSKYGKLLDYVSYRILRSTADVEECVNDTYMKAWESMPPKRPNYLSAFLAKITRNLSINRYLKNKARQQIMYTDSIFDEIAECVPDSVEHTADDIALKDAINGFLESLSKKHRVIFVKRYFYMMSIKEISAETDTTVSNVKVSLMRTRESFKLYLEKEGINL